MVRLGRLLMSPAVILVACAVILFLRKPDQFSNPQFWAEDGYFYHSWYLRHWATLFDSYAGYLHMLPRIIAATCWLVDPAHVPHWFVGWAAATTLYVCARAMSARIPMGSAPLLALAVTLVPDAFEVLLNVVNLQWVVAAGFVLLLISTDPDDWLGYTHDVAAAVVAGLTGPFSVFLAPLFVVRAFVRKTRASWILASLVALTAAVQLNFIRQYQEPHPAKQQINVADGIGAIGTRLAGSLFTGARLNEESPQPIRWILAGVTMALVGGIALRKSTAGSVRPETAPLLVGVFAVLLAASLFRCRWVLTELQHAGYGARYFFPLQLIVLWLVVSMLSDPRRAWRWAAGGLLVGAVALNFSRLREPALVDLHWKDYAPTIRAGQAVTIPINPEGWTIPLPARGPREK